MSYRNHVAITKADADFAAIDALYVGGTGSVIATDPDGTVVTYTAVPAGTTLPVRMIRVAAASGATLLVGLID